MSDPILRKSCIPTRTHGVSHYLVQYSRSGHYHRWLSRCAGSQDGTLFGATGLGSFGYFEHYFCGFAGSTVCVEILRWLGLLFITKGWFWSFLPGVAPVFSFLGESRLGCPYRPFRITTVAASVSFRPVAGGIIAAYPKFLTCFGRARLSERIFRFLDFGRKYLHQAWLLIVRKLDSFSAREVHRPAYCFGCLNFRWPPHRQPNLLLPLPDHCLRCFLTTV